MNKNLYTERMKWFCNARFGMFIHWGIYAIPARGEWIQSIEKIPSEIYDKYFGNSRCAANRRCVGAVRICTGGEYRVAGCKNNGNAHGKRCFFFRKDSRYCERLYAEGV